MSQVFVVVAAGSVLSFIIRELGEPAIASWVIQVHPFKNPVSRCMHSHTIGTAPDAISFVTSRRSTV
jgi:hypothetical protein